VTEHLQTNDRPNIQTYALCTFTSSLQTFTIFFLINTFINVYYNFFTFITSARGAPPLRPSRCDIECPSVSSFWIKCPPSPKPPSWHLQKSQFCKKAKCFNSKTVIFVSHINCFKTANSQLGTVTCRTAVKLMTNLPIRTLRNYKHIQLTYP